jgi:hypothetical protein
MASLFVFFIINPSTGFPWLLRIRPNGLNTRRRTLLRDKRSIFIYYITINACPQGEIPYEYGRRIKKRSFPFGALGPFFDASEVFQPRSSQQRSVQSEWSWRAMYVP